MSASQRGPVDTVLPKPSCPLLRRPEVQLSSDQGTSPMVMAKDHHTAWVSSPSEDSRDEPSEVHRPPSVRHSCQPPAPSTALNKHRTTGCLHTGRKRKEHFWSLCTLSLVTQGFCRGSSGSLSFQKENQASQQLTGDLRSGLSA